MYGSSIQNIQNPELRKIVGEALNHASKTIENDLLETFDGSKSDDDLIANWQLKLEGLKQETEHYWSALEKMKG